MAPGTEAVPPCWVWAAVLVNAEKGTRGKVFDMMNRFPGVDGTVERALIDSEAANPHVLVKLVSRAGCAMDGAIQALRSRYGMGMGPHPAHQSRVPADLEMLLVGFLCVPLSEELQNWYRVRGRSPSYDTYAAEQSAPSMKTPGSERAVPSTDGS